MMKTIREFAAGTCGPLSPGAALEFDALRVELATPRPLRPQIMLVRNTQEAALIAAMIDNARACRADIQRAHQRIRADAEEM